MIFWFLVPGFWFRVPGTTAQGRITANFIDPSGIKVIEDIAASTAKPHAGIIATAIGVVIALFGASGVFGQLQEALNTIWGGRVEPMKHAVKMEITEEVVSD